MCESNDLLDLLRVLGMGCAEWQCGDPMSYAGFDSAPLVSRNVLVLAMNTWIECADSNLDGPSFQFDDSHMELGAHY